MLESNAMREPSGSEKRTGGGGGGGAMVGKDEVRSGVMVLMCACMHTLSPLSLSLCLCLKEKVRKLFAASTPDELFTSWCAKELAKFSVDVDG